MRRRRERERTNESFALEQNKRSHAKVSSDSVVYKDMRLMEVFLEILTLLSKDAVYALIWHTEL